jgi:hypothetical protein
LVTIGIILMLTALYAWIRSNRQEATPSAAQAGHIREFIETEFAPLVATAERSGGSTRGIAADPGWRQVFAYRVRLHAEFAGLSTRDALKIFDAHADEAVARHLERVHDQHPGRA